MESGTEGRETECPPGGKLVLVPPLRRGDQHGCRRSVSVTTDIREEPIRRHFERARHSIDEILIRLVHQEHFYLSRGFLVTLENLLDRGGNLARCLHDNRPSVHLER